MSLPEGFVYLHEYNSSIKYDIKYATHDNFIGRPLEGYQANVCILTETVAKVLVKLQQHVGAENFELMIYEAYRPQCASEDIVRWCQDLQDQQHKRDYYPEVDKSDLHQQHYIMQRSAHTRGSTVDLTLLDKNDGSPIEMGTRFDFFGPDSHPDNKEVAAKAYENRQYLRNLMQQYGFAGIPTEWWHFTLTAEPFVDTYFDFPVK